MMDVLYIANARVPSRKAHVYQIIQMCDAFAATGHDVELVIPDRTQPDDAPNSAREYFDSSMDFEVTALPCLDFLWLTPPSSGVLGRIAFYLQTVTFTLAALLYIPLSDYDIVYTRSRLFAFLGSLVYGDDLVVEVHRRSSQSWVTKATAKAFDHCRGIVVISDGLRQEWDAVTEAPIYVAPDGVDLTRFDLSASKGELREELDLPTGRLACYTGSLQPWKGVDTLAEAARELSDIDVCLVGGTNEQQKWLRETVDIPDNVHLIGHVPPGEVPKYLIASDVLVVPNTAERPISAKYTSPLKVFEYMAAGRPIVATDIPSLREILDEECAYFAAPDSPSSLAGTIDRVFSDPDVERRVTEARERVKEYSWSARAARISEAFFTDSREV